MRLAFLENRELWTRLPQHEGYLHHPKSIANTRAIASSSTRTNPCLDHRLCS